MSLADIFWRESRLDDGKKVSSPGRPLALTFIHSRQRYHYLSTFVTRVNVMSIEDFVHLTLARLLFSTKHKVS